MEGQESRMVRLDRGGSQLLPVDVHLALASQQMAVQAALQGEAMKLNGLTRPVADAIDKLMDSGKPGAIRASVRLELMTASGPFSGNFEMHFERAM